MDRDTNNAMYARLLSEEVTAILERDASNNAWDLIDKLKLPMKSFLWIEDKEDRRKWHLPYREGTGGIDPETKLFRQAGAVNLNALKAIDQAMGGSESRMPSVIPKEIKSKIIKILKEFNIGQYSESRENTMDYNILESSISGQFKEGSIDKENRLIKGVLLLNPTSRNIYVKGSKGTRFAESFLKEIASNIEGKKFYKNHASTEALKDTRGIRDINDLLGIWENGRMDGGVPRADIKYLAHQATFVESLMEVASTIGTSIVANGAMSYDNESKIAEAFSLKSLHSADLVTEPGSTNNMFESENPIVESEEENMDYKTITLKEILENRSDLVEAIGKNIREDLSSKEEVDGYKNTIKELTEKNAAQAKVIDEYEVKEAVSAKDTKIAELLEEAKVPAELITETFKKTLSEAKDEAAMKALIEDRQAITKGIKIKKQVTGAGASTNIDESAQDDLSDEDLEKEITEAANSRG